MWYIRLIKKFRIITKDTVEKTLRNLIGPLFEAKNTYLNINQLEKPNIIIPVGERYFKWNRKNIMGKKRRKIIL